MCGRNNNLKIIRFWLFILFGVFFSFLKAQNNTPLKGSVADFSTKELLIGVTVSSPETGKAVFTNADGKFELRTEQPITRLKVSFIGYRDTIISISNAGNNPIKIVLFRDYKALAEVEVVTNSNDPNEKTNKAEMGVDKISMIEAKLLPAIFGEVDIIKILQLKPGVKAGGEGTAGFFVRGGGSDQNLILVDRAPVYNPNHLLGFFSVFNSDAVKNVTLYKSGFPAQFGGRLS